MISFTKTRRKIALFFSLFSSLLIVLVDILIIIFLNYEIDNQAYLTLEQAIGQVSEEYVADELKEKDIKVQQESPSISYDYNRSVNVFERLESESENQVNLNDSVMSLNKDFSNWDLDKLQELKQVYSRVILSNGDISFTSELFENLPEVELTEGFEKRYQPSYDTNVYTLTYQIAEGEDSGTWIQVGVYAPFTNSQQRDLFLIIFVVALLVSPITFIFGLLISKWLLTPLEKSAKETKEFAHTVYHELMTPITVAMTTVDATKSTASYEEGIESVSEDLEEVFNSLEILKNKMASKDQIFQENVRMDFIIKNIVEECEEKIAKYGLEINSDLKKVEKRFNKQLGKIVIRNIIENAVKYSSSGEEVSIDLNEDLLTIRNKADGLEDLKLDKIFVRGYRGSNGRNVDGRGLGLAIAKELCEILGWQLSVRVEEGEFVVEMRIAL